MAGTYLHIDLDDAAAQAELERLIERGENLDTPFRAFGEYLLLEMWPRRFREKIGPDGGAWAPVSALYDKRKRAGKATPSPGDARTTNPADLLQLTGELMDRPRYQMVGPDEMEFGVNTPWAATHQFGDPSRNIPARPYMFLDAVDRDEAARIFLAWLRG